MLMNEKNKTDKIIAQELNNDITIMEGNFRGYLRKPKSKPSFSKSQLKNVKEELEKVAESLDMSSPKPSPKSKGISGMTLINMLSFCNIQFR